jgi:hypothetical protein
VLRYYYDNASTTDYFVTGVSGKGYMFPSSMDATDLQHFYADTDTLMRRCDLEELWTTQLGLGSAATTVATTTNTTVKAIFDGYGDQVYLAPEKLDGVPIVHTYTTDNNTGPVFDYITNLASMAIDHPVFVFLILDVWSGAGDPTYWNDLAARLQAAGVQVVMPDVISYLLGIADLSTKITLPVTVPGLSLQLVLLALGLVLMVRSTRRSQR